MTGFRAPPWAWFAVVIGVALFGTLGGWQLHRGQAKAGWLAQFARADAPAVTLSARTPVPPPLALQRATARGQWWPERQLLADGQARGGRPGYHVWTPLRLAGGGIVLVNRGWIPQPYDPAAGLLALPAGEIAVGGWWRDLPRPGLRVGEEACREPARFPAVVVYPDAAQLACLLGGDVLPGLLLLDPAAGHGFVREWTFTAIPPARHYGYAATWFGLGATALILFVILNRK